VGRRTALAAVDDHWRK